MKVLVTGGAGYIGSHTIIELIAKGFEEIVSADNYLNSSELEYQKIQKITGKKIKHYPIDLADSAATLELFKKENFDGVIHFAALKSVPESVEMPGLYYRNNLNALINVLDAMQATGVNRIIFSSSCSVYGNPELLPVDENTPFGIPESPYAHTKQMGEQILENYCKLFSNLRALSLRYFNPAGAHKSGLIGEVKTKRPNNLVPIIAQNAIGWRENFTVFGDDYATADGSCIRDYVHVSDVAEAHILAYNWLEKMNCNYDVINLGTGNGSSTLEVVKAFENLPGVKLNYSIGSRRAGDVESIYTDNKKAIRLLNWTPKYSLQDIVQSAWTWQQNAGN